MFVHMLEQSYAQTFLEGSHTMVHADMHKTVTQAPLVLDKVGQHLLSDPLHCIH
jgi:hypothetical protein